MQLIIVSIALALLLFSQQVMAQVREMANTDDTSPIKGDTAKPKLSLYEDNSWNNVDVQFLSSYYEQDGNNSAVTGGIGTEHLTDFTQKLIVKVPMNKQLTLNVDGGYDYYTSASSDKIDPIRSDDSAEDTRVHANIGVTRKLDKQQTIGFRLGSSFEYDYNSVQGGISYTRESKDKNTFLNAQAQAFIDTWKVIYPIELRDGTQHVPTSARQSFNFALGISRILDKKTQVSLNLEGIYMNGLLSTPFHRVYFQEQNAARVERLPGTRLKIPIGFRLNRYISEHLIARAYYRLYWDSWGMLAHTESLEVPVKINRFLAVTPFYRYHTQTGADYFKPYKEHSITDQYYTSDFDLAPLNSHALGLGISYQPAKGIFNAKLPGKKGKQITLKGADLKYSHYIRSTGFNANIISLGLGFTIH